MAAASPRGSASQRRSVLAPAAVDVRSSASSSDEPSAAGPRDSGKSSRLRRVATSSRSPPLPVRVVSDESDDVAVGAVRPT